MQQQLHALYTSHIAVHLVTTAKWFAVAECNMKTVINDVVQQNIESMHTEEFHVDEERELISMTIDGLISVINTVVQVAAEKVSDPAEREAILKMCN